VLIFGTPAPRTFNYSDDFRQKASFLSFLPDTRLIARAEALAKGCCICGCCVINNWGLVSVQLGDFLSLCLARGIIAELANLAKLIPLFLGPD